MHDVLDDTIVAISTAAGRSAVGIVRLSGPKTLAIADRIAEVDQARPISDHKPSTRIEGAVILDANRSIPAVFYSFKAPHSYTRQDLVEIHTIGAPPVLDWIVGRAIALGARQAQPGEFTARAYLNGAMDLSAAEGVAGIIRAQTDTQLKAARRLGDGDLAGRIEAVSRRLAELAALVEADIDFVEEPIEFIASDELCRRLSAIDAELDTLDRRAVWVERIDVLPRVLLFGSPNAGKSSLMNVLSGTRRAICSAAAGTTRDVLTAPARLGRCEALLLDVAGFDDHSEPRPSGSGFSLPDCSGWHTGIDKETSRRLKPAAQQAQEKALAEARSVDVVCVVVDASVEVERELVEIVRSWEEASIVWAANKLDLVDAAARDRVAEQLAEGGFQQVSFVSARTGAGIEDLRRRLGDALGVVTGSVGSDAVVLTARQRFAIADARAGANRAIALGRGAKETKDCADLLAFELRDALDALGKVTGQVTTEDLLGQVFASFCIGK